MDEPKKEKNSSIFLITAILWGFVGTACLLDFFLKPAQYLRATDLGWGLAFCYLAIVFAYQYHASKSGKEFKTSNKKLAALILIAIPIAITSTVLAKPIIHSRLLNECEQIPVLAAEGMTSPALEYCYYNAAIQTKDATICEKIKNPETKKDCYSKTRTLEG
ncbi:MAG: hypothetical protein QXK06_04570 [Candidatus Diapherotrites archaeon]